MMFRQRVVLCGFALAVAVACSSDPACSGAECDAPNSSTDKDEVPDADIEAEYVGGTTDEALAHLNAVAAKDSDEHRIVLDMPSTKTLSASSPPTFSFHVQGSEGRITPRLPTPSVKGEAPGLLLRSWREFARLVGPERAAHAHGAPYNGDAYLLRFAAKGGASELNVFTAESSFVPSAEQWGALLEAEGPFSLQITWASFEENEVVEGGGPFVGLDFQFSVAKK